MYGDDAMTVVPAEAGLLMARYYLSFDTMRTICGALECVGMEELLSKLTLAKEFGDVKLRRNEKKDLNAMNKKLPYKLGKKVQTGREKVFILLQASFSDDEVLLKLPALRMEAIRLCQLCVRIVRCMVDYMLARVTEVQFAAMNTGIELRRCLERKQSPTGNQVLKQLKGVGDATSRQLRDAGITSFDQLEHSQARKLEGILGKNPPYGNDLLAKLKAIPKLVLHAFWNNGCELVMEGTIQSRAVMGSLPLNEKVLPLFLLVATSPTSPPLHSRFFRLNIGETFRETVKFTWDKELQRGQSATVVFGSMVFCGLDISCKVGSPEVVPTCQKIMGTANTTERASSTISPFLDRVRQKAETIPKLRVKRLRTCEVRLPQSHCQRRPIVLGKFKKTSFAFCYFSMCLRTGGYTSSPGPFHFRSRVPSSDSRTCFETNIFNAKQ